MSTLTGVSKMDKERGNTISPIEADGDPYTFDLTSDDLEEMLAPAATFDVLEIPDTTVAEDFNEPPRQFNTADYGEHRKASYSFPHMHKPMMPLKGHHHRHRKKRSRANLREPTSTNSTQGALAGDVADATVTSTTRKHQSAPVMQSPAGDAITTTGSLSSMGGRVDSDTVPSDTEPVEGAPRIAEPVEGAPRIAEPVEGASRIAEPVEGAPRVAEPVEGAPRIAEPVEGASRIAEPVEGAPRVAEPGEGASRVAHMSFVSEKPLSLRARHQAQFYVGSGTQLAEDIAEEEAEEMITLLNKEESDKAVPPPPPPVTIGSGEASQSDAATPPRKVSFVLGHSEASEASRLAGSDISRKGSTDLRMSSADDDDMKDREDGLPRRRRIGVQHSEAPSIPEQQQSRRRKRSGQRNEMEQRRRKGSHVMFHNDNLLQRILEADMRGSDTLHETSDETDDEAGPLARHDALSCALRRTSTYQTGHRRRVSAAIHHHRPSVPGMMLQDEYIGPKPKKWDHIPHEIVRELEGELILVSG
ncbi:PREDICTED: uncharacterized protein LOC106809004 [Priapulus caudatus]|uniref:Uncharacterized protein LOC106809004 n=1 Tax=Priapulus caudatus TaxID=37621 RepID=A0ABM1E5F8_PRICU|nr:PREDICTED: uncharacterized protein LOC106809004 [Priapulus caudatus]